MLTHCYKILAGKLRVVAPTEPQSPWGCVLFLFSLLQPISEEPEDGRVLVVGCSEHVVTALVIPDLLLLAAYLFGVYLFRYGEPEHLQTLMETVSLAFCCYTVQQQKDNKSEWVLYIHAN